MRKIPGSLFQLDLVKARSEGQVDINVFHLNELVFQKSGIIPEEVVNVIQNYLETRDLNIPRNRVEIIVREELKNPQRSSQGLVEGTVSEMLSEFQKMPSASLKKIILMGLSNAGKTCIYERVFEGKKPNELLQSAATKGISYREYDLGKAGTPMIWDLGGQKQYLDEYHGPMKEAIFQKASTLLYVVDVLDTERYEAARGEFEWATNQMLAKNPNATLHIFLHKIDLVQNKDEVVKQLVSFFSQATSHRIFFHPTSIFDETLFKAWSAIIQEMSTKSGFINTLLKQLIKQDGIRDALLVLRKTGLAIGSTFEFTEEEIAVGLFSLMVVTIDRVTKEMKLESLKEFRLKTTANYVLLTDVSPDLLLVMILSKPNLDPEAMGKIEMIVKDLSHQLERIIETTEK